jgi:hypothetical protein
VDRVPSLAITEAEGRVLVHDFGGCPQDAVINALQERSLWAKGGQWDSRKPVAVYDYRDERGALLYQVVRKPGKVFQQRRPDGKAGWIYKLDGVRRVPYRLPQLLAADPAEWVHITEGEKDADNLARLGLVATTNSEGAGTWRDELSPHLQGRRVAILPDNDAPGQAHAQDVAAKVAPYAAEVRIVNLPGLPDKGDVSDWLDQGHTADEVAALVEAAPIWEPPAAVDAAALLDDVVAFIRRYVVLSALQAVALALWVLHTWVLDAAETTPYLSITSPEKRSGKTRLLEVLSLLAARPWFTGRVTPAVLVRKVALQTPTLLLDETDAAFAGEREYAEALRAVLNAGYRRGAVASLCVKAGGDFELKDLPVFGCKAIAGIGKLPDTVADRAISIVLKRRAPSESVARFRWREAREAADPLRERLERWAPANVKALAEARPDIPPALDDRAADGWEPLLAIADAAGGDWPERTRKAALELSAGHAYEDDSLGVRLLRDIRSVFTEEGADRLASGELVAALVAMEEAPWGDLRGKPLDARGLARLLRRYSICPHNLRSGDSVAKGYEVGDFADSWARYTPEIAATSVTSATNPCPKYNTGGPSVADVADVAAPAGIHTPCPHRPPGEVEDRWAHGDGGPDAHACACCGGPVSPSLWAGGLCPHCRNGRPVSGSLVRLALDLGAKVVTP